MKLNDFLTNKELETWLKEHNPTAEIQLVFTNNPDEYLKIDILPEKLVLPEGYRYSPRWGITNLPINYNPSRNSANVVYTEPVIHTSLRVVYNG